MTAAVQNETWLKQLLGTWSYRFATAAGGEHEGFTITGTETVRAIGEVFVAMESIGTGSDGSASHSLVTLGFNPERQRFAGAHAGSAVAALFVYDGELAEDGAALYLETMGAPMTEGNTVDDYRDVLRILGTDAREQVMEVRDTDGGWREFGRIRFNRVSG